MAYQLVDVINWFLSKESMSPKKLQKLLYYAYSWFLTLQNESSEDLENRLFVAEFEAWVHGPVIYSVYDQFREKGYRPIEQFQGNIPVFDAETTDILEQVWEEYGHFTGNELESITHQESPWIRAREGFSPLDRCDVAISDRDIFECYVERLEE
ncbi:type II toxin-antitoxin system antitoxin SocA domain-containing protein [Neobacillus drentensis]|uniref:Panacea domain-containing protein n=1 Tax=Neobacillus drentensis TaxID=220684 RepID=UPI002FFFAA64